MRGGGGRDGGGEEEERKDGLVLVFRVPRADLTTPPPPMCDRSLIMVWGCYYLGEGGWEGVMKKRVWLYI